MILKKGLIIGYFTLLESVVKVYISTVLLVWVAVFPTSADFLNKPILSAMPLNIIAFMFVIAGWIEVFCSMKLIYGMKSSIASNLLWWIVFQPLTIINLVFISYIAYAFAEKSEDIEFIVYTLAVFYVMMHVYFLFSIVLLYFVLREGEPTKTTKCVDKPPSYKESLPTPA